MNRIFLWKSVSRARIKSRLSSRTVWPIRAFVIESSSELIKVAENVENARTSISPIVSLESNIYTHGWPYPDNIQLAFHLQDLIRSHGAIPATVGVINGVATVGLSDREIVTLCTAASDPTTLRVSRRDLPYILGMGITGNKIHGGTTISGTVFLSRWAGISVVGAGGIGGVHLGGQDSLDISADLMELSRTPIAVICGGFKSYMDTARSLEFLETQGAVVATFADGRDGNVDFPGFFTRSSGVKSPKVFWDPKEAAAITFSLAKLGTRGNRYTRPGSLFANPISEALSIPKDEIHEAIKQASSEATNQGIFGNEITPFLLARVRDITDGRSLSANRAVLESNVIMASKIAVHLASLWAKEDHTIKQKESLDIGKPFLARRNLTVSFAEPRESKKPETFVKKEDPSKEIKAPKSLVKKHLTNNSKFFGQAKAEASKANEILRPDARPEYSPDIAVIGTVAIELTCNLILGPNAAFNVDLQPNMNSSNISRIEQNIGGVSHNVALAAHLVSGSQRVRLCSLVADDSSGSMIMRSLKTETLDLSGVKILPRVVDRSGIAVPNRTAQYVAVNDGKKDLVLGMADMQIFRHNSYDCSKLTLKRLKWAIIDANWTRKVVRGLMSMFRTNYPLVKIAFEPTSEQRGADIFQTSANPSETPRFPSEKKIFRQKLAPQSLPPQAVTLPTHALILPFSPLLARIFPPPPHNPHARTHNRHRTIPIRSLSPNFLYPITLKFIEPRNNLNLVRVHRVPRTPQLAVSSRSWTPRLSHSLSSLSPKKTRGRGFLNYPIDLSPIRIPRYSLHVTKTSTSQPRYTATTPTSRCPLLLAHQLSSQR